MFSKLFVISRKNKVPFSVFLHINLFCNRERFLFGFHGPSLWQVHITVQTAEKKMDAFERFEGKTQLSGA